MKKIILLILALPILISCTIKTQQPNFVFILVDDLGWADVQCNNPESFYETPNINSLAESGIRFTNAYSSNPVCSPTRASIMTGKHPNKVNITDWIPGLDPKNKPLLGPQDGEELALEEITIAEALKGKGYKTCFIGKWHLGDTGFFPEDQGFDINIGGHHKGNPPGGYYSPYKNPKLKDGPEGEYLTNRLTTESLQFIKENKNNPFLLYLSFYTVHTPIQASKKHIEKYEAKLAELGSKYPRFKKEGDGMTRLAQDSAPFASMVAAMDENVGRVISMLKEEGLDENTWIIFTSDNGGLSTKFRKNSPTCNLPLRAGKGWCYEGGIRVPLIVSGPGIKTQGQVSDVPSISMDHFATIMDIAGIGHKAEDGISLLPVFEDTPTPRRDLFWHFPHYHGSAWKPGSAIRSGNWKYIIHYEDNKEELFNLKDDIGETTDLSAANPEKLNELRQKYKGMLQSTNAKLPTINENYVAPEE